MSDIAITLNSRSSFVIPKLCDNVSNWADYEPWAKNAIGAKGLMKHAEGCARQPAPLILLNDVLMSRDDPTKPVIRPAMLYGQKTATPTLYITLETMNDLKRCKGLVKSVPGLTNVMKRMVKGWIS